MQLLIAVKEEKFVESKNPEVPPAILHVLKRGLSNEPEERFASMRVLLDALAAAATLPTAPASARAPVLMDEDATVPSGATSMRVHEGRENAPEPTAFDDEMTVPSGVSDERKK